MPQGAVAASIRSSCCDVVRAMPSFFLGTGGSLAGTGFISAMPHRMPRVKALETTPAMLRTVLRLSGFPDLRPLPPDDRSRFHSREKCSGLTLVGGGPLKS